MTAQNVSIRSEACRSSSSSPPDIKAQARAKPWIISLALVLIAFSAACRLYHLNEKLFWFDEEGTAILVAPNYKIRREWTGRPMVPAEWRKLEQVDKSAPITQVLDNLRSKSIPDQAPFYYLATRVWTQICGDNPGDFRLVSVVFSFLALPLVFALAMELFNSRTVSWLSLAIFSVSPFNMVYAQEARPYSMWVCALLLFWLTLAQAHRLQTSKKWLLFGLCNAVNVLTHYSSFLLMAAAFAASLAGRRLAVIRGLAVATIVTVLVLAPWFIYAGLGCFSSCTDAWIRLPATFSHYIGQCLENAGKLVFDLSISAAWLKIPDGFLLLFLYIPAVVLAYKQTSSGGRVVLQSAAVYLLSFVAVDVLFGGIRFLVMRYLTPAIPIVQLCLANYVGHMLQVRKRTGIFLLSFLVVAGVFSCSLIAKSDYWWTKAYFGHDEQAIASFLNKKGNPLLIDPDLYEVLLISRLVDRNVLLELAKPGRCNIPANLTDVFVCDPAGKLLPAICSSGQWIARPIPICSDFWQLSRRSSERAPAREF